MLGPNQLMECTTFNISLSPEMSNILRGDTSYYALAFEPGGNVTMTLVGYEPSSLHWTIQHPAGTQLFVVLLDSFGKSLGVLPDMYMVIRESVHDCLTGSESPGTPATEPKITLPVFGLRPWETSFSGRKPPYSVSVVAFKSGSVYDYSVPSEKSFLPYTRGVGTLSGKAIGKFLNDP
ncbi:hypothetical protein OG21DRAFT_1419234 [Imleria badia]|nr:hypothetical protein OG21DRAFT_1419234 [Imleria badia]